MVRFYGINSRLNVTSLFKNSKFSSCRVVVHNKIKGCHYSCKLKRILPKLFKHN